MRRHPRLFAKRAARRYPDTPIAQLSDKQLGPCRPTVFTRWRKQKDQGGGCPGLPGGRPLHSWTENGRITNDTHDIDIIATWLQQGGEWTDPNTGKVYLTTWAAGDEPYCVCEQDLQRGKRQDLTFLDGGRFHPHPTKRGASRGFKPCRMWPKDEVQLYVRRRQEANKVPAAVQFIKRLFRK
jgi:hypothetical protein